MRSFQTPLIATLGCSLMLSLAACSSSGQVAGDSSNSPSPSNEAPSPTSAPDPTSSPAPTAAPGQSASSRPTPSTPAQTPAADSPAAALEKMSLTQRAGQVLAIAVKSDESTLAASSNVLKAGVGNYYLSGRGQGGTAGSAALAKKLDAAVAQNGSKVLAYAGVDQEGGQVQVLHGPGYSEIPSAIDQGQQSPGTLKGNAQKWGSELAAGSMNMMLGPVMDTVPSKDFAPQNKPIGFYQRNFGFTPEAVKNSAMAVVSGLQDAGVSPVVKHYPGLGRVQGNTDVTADVHDTQTTRTDPALAPFTAAIKDGAPWVMLSNAIYDKIDATQPAPMSPAIMQMLRKDAGFKGGIMSDDLCAAVQMKDYSIADRAVGFINAGGTMALCQNPEQGQLMLSAIAGQAQKDPAFKAKVDAAALNVLTQKKAAGLL